MAGTAPKATIALEHSMKEEAWEARCETTEAARTLPPSGPETGRRAEVP